MRTFTFFNDDNVSIAGAVGQDYTITVTGEIGTITAMTASETFTLTLKNPCIDRNFVKIDKVNLPSGLQYALWDYDAHPLGFTFNHLPFTVSTIPLVGHTMCGDLAYRAYFEGPTVLSTPTRPMAYDETTL